MDFLEQFAPKLPNAITSFPAPFSATGQVAVKRHTEKVLSELAYVAAVPQHAPLVVGGGPGDIGGQLV